MAIVVTFYLVQKKNDERKIKEKLEDVLSKFQLIILSPTALLKNNFNQNEILLVVRTANNKLNLLTKYVEKYELKELTKEIEYIADKYNEYRVFIGDNLRDEEYLKNQKAKDNVQRLLSCIDDKCDEIKLCLYI